MACFQRGMAVTERLAIPRCLYIYVNRENQLSLMRPEPGLGHFLHTKKCLPDPVSELSKESSYWEMPTI